MTQETSIDSLINSRKKEGRGQGNGATYIPWLTAREVPSKGRTFRPKGIKTGREHIFFSEWEYFYFLLLEWSDYVLDIREQFPLLELKETLEIAKELNVDHPIDPKKNSLKVMTTDFLITFSKGDEVAVSFKPYKSITAREIEKMEIERIYWERRGVAWELITDKDVPVVYAKNVDYVHSTYNLKDYQISKSILNKVRRLLEPLVMQRQTKLTDLTNQIDDRLGLPPGNSLTIVRHLIISKRWIVDMNEKIEPNTPLNITRINMEEEIGERRHAN